MHSSRLQLRHEQEESRVRDHYLELSRVKTTVLLIATIPDIILTQKPKLRKTCSGICEFISLLPCPFSQVLTREA